MEGERVAELEKVIEGLERCIRYLEHIYDNPCFKCPYSCQCQEGYTSALKEDALELLKEYKRKDGCPCTHCEEYECEKVCDEYREWYKNNKAI